MRYALRTAVSLVPQTPAFLSPRAAVEAGAAFRSSRRWWVLFVLAIIRHRDQTV
jgi:hypothetical protein